MAWTGRPAIYVFDCSASGILIPFIESGNSDNSKDDFNASSFGTGGDEYDNDASEQGNISGAGGQSNTAGADEDDGGGVAGDSSQLKEIFVLAACGPNEILPMNPDYPADLFTVCLTTPIRMALRWFALVIYRCLLAFKLYVLMDYIISMHVKNIEKSNVGAESESYRNCKEDTGVRE